MLRAHALTVTRSGRPLLDAVDLTVPPGALVALVGPAGAGKTLLLETFLGRHRPAAGTVRVAGLDVAGRPAIAAPHLAWVPAQPSFDPALSPLAHLAAACRALGRRMPEPVLRAALLRSGLALAHHERPLRGAPPAIARQLAFTVAALHNVDAWLLDEPARDLDPAAQAVLVAGLRRLRKRGAAVLLATRDLDFARSLATQIVTLDAGAVVADIAPHVSRRDHADASYLSALVG